MIHFKEVSKIYSSAEGPVEALKLVDLNIDSGEFIAVTGPSGCGKSTLLSLAGALVSPTEGQVTITGLDLSELSSAQRAQLRAEQIGFVFQMFHLLPYLNVLDNVLVGATGRADARLRQRASELLDNCGLGNRITHLPTELSAGECQRVAVARAMLVEPPLILADEPTGNLDPENSAALLGLLSDYNKNGGTVLLVTHDPKASAIASREIHLRAGRIE
jgi:ABC-type lipoprotein export system ATPase subunit